MRIPTVILPNQTDAGESWKSVLIDSKSTEEEKAPVDFSSNSNLVVAEGALYAIASEEENLRIYRLSTDTNIFASVPSIPTFHVGMLSTELWKSITEAKYISLYNRMEMDTRLITALRRAATPCDNRWICDQRWNVLCGIPASAFPMENRRFRMDEYRISRPYRRLGEG